MEEPSLFPDIQGWQPGLTREEQWAKVPPQSSPWQTPEMGLPRPSLRRRVALEAQKSFRVALKILEEARQKRALEVLKDVAVQDAGPQHQRMIDYTGSYTPGLVRIAKRHTDRYNAQRRIPRLEDSFAEPSYMMRGQAGDEVLMALRTSFARFPEKPTKFQWMIFDAVCCAAKALIYGEEYAKRMVSFFTHNGKIGTLQTPIGCWREMDGVMV
jgi:hypothetical protein